MHNVNIFLKLLYFPTFPGRNSRTVGIGEKERKEMVKILKGGGGNAGAWDWEGEAYYGKPLGYIEMYLLFDV